MLKDCWIVSRRGRALRRIGALTIASVLAWGGQDLAAQASTGTVTGQVTATSTGRALAGAQVFIPGLDLGALSSGDGRYVIERVPAGEVTVTVRMLGYSVAEQTISVGQGATVTLNFELRQQALGLDAIVVTGTPGQREARSIGNVVGRIDVSELQAVAPVRTMDQLLSGGEAGMSINFGGMGSVASGANIRIRGPGSIALGSAPLIYIDGVQVRAAESDAGPGIDSRAAPSRLNDLNPEEIESIEVIKGPAASTLYGTEASNGVINIITRRGQAGAPRISLRMGTGLNWMPSPENTYPSLFYRCRGFGDCVPGEVVEFNPLRHDREVNGVEHFRTGVPQNVGITVEGGSDQFRFLTSMDLARDEGAIPTDWRNQLNARANLTWTPSDRFNVQVGLGAVQSKLRDGEAGGLSLGIIWACPAPGCEAGTGLASGMDGGSRGFLNVRRPWVIQDSLFATQDVQRSTNSFQITYRPWDWLDQRLILGSDFGTRTSSYLALPLGGAGHGAATGARSIQTLNSRYLSFDYAATGTFDPTSTIRSSTSAGLQYRVRTETAATASSTRFSVQGLETLDAGALQTVTEVFVEDKSVGVFVQEELAWKERLFLTGAVRGDDHSAFGADFSFVAYPKLSASWVMSEESFLENVDWLDELRVRGAWGQAGQQPAAFVALRTYGPIPGPGGRGGLTPINFGNPELKPEVGEEFELGFDTSVLEGRLGVVFTYYNQTRKDALIAVPPRPSTGFPGLEFQNLGEVKNKGVELGLTSQAYQRPGLGVTLGLNIAHNTNEITNMGGVPPLVLQESNPTTEWAQQLYVEGYPLGAMFMKRVLSADIEGQGASARAVNVMCEGGAIDPRSLDGFPISRGGGGPVPCAQAPNIFQGTPIPPWEISGNTSVRIGQNLSLYAQVDYRGGHKLVEGNIAGSHIALFRHTRAIVERTDPILLGIESLGRDGRNQSGLMDASFARLRNVAATYTVPRSWAEQIGADRLSVSVSGQNLWLIWRAQTHVFGHPIMDPEASETRSTQSDPGSLTAYHQSMGPALRRVMATVRVTF